MTVGAIILAAGQSRRMGANKLIAEFRGKPLVAHIVDAVASAGLPPPIVVTGHAQDLIVAALAGRDARFVHAGDHGAGLSRSLAAGLMAVPSAWQAAIICLGDMPLVSPDLLRAMAGLAAPDAIVAPCHAGRRGNPVLWGRTRFARLAGIHGDVGGKALLDELINDVVEIAWDDASILRDVDTPADLAALRGEFR
ncbi:nucleotidyltransferase family protein [Sphingomonas sp. KC8]|uniref:nucleotidyltransferase family protein n=1 Tax=Sphingomonas sp. KC8 TaxID=1030157 RepID=UPI0002488A6F|nr:nucleotidyltransferase family protein [Sphingomonas sp. KC8]ARS25840.1 4-diphosphocytidyl-2C-methyl-D-erythritol synthase [Sphingomonas sp. KC8]